MNAITTSNSTLWTEMTDDLAEIVNGGHDNGSFVTGNSTGVTGTGDAATAIAVADPGVASDLASNSPDSGSYANNNNYRYCYCYHYRYNYSY